VKAGWQVSSEGAQNQSLCEPGLLCLGLRTGGGAWSQPKHLQEDAKLLQGRSCIEPLLAECTHDFKLQEKECKQAP